MNGVESEDREARRRFYAGMILGSDGVDRLDAILATHRQAAYAAGREAERENSAAMLEALRAIEPFADAFATARANYTKRYGADAEIGQKNFDNMPDHWPMDNLKFNMGQYRALCQALDKIRAAIAAAGG